MSDDTMPRYTHAKAFLSGEVIFRRVGLYHTVEVAQVEVSGSMVSRDPKVREMEMELAGVLCEYLSARDDGGESMSDDTMPSD